MVNGCIRFTYDYGMLKDGRDSEGLYELIDGALEYVLVIFHFLVEILLNTGYSDAKWISHIPWAFPFLAHVPGASAKWTKMQKVGEDTVEYRVKLGPTRKDLFHHLVRMHSMSPPFHILIA